MLSPLPNFSGSSSRNRLSFHQPILRLPFFNSIRAFRGSSDVALDSNAEHESPATDRGEVETQTVPAGSLSPTSPSTPSTAGLPSTPPNDVTESFLSDDLDLYAYADDEDDEAEIRLRKRRMDKLMRHLGECVPSELVTGSARGRASISTASRSIPSSVSMDSAPPISTTTQSKMTRRVSVVSVMRKRSVAEGYDSGTGYRSGSDRSDRLVKDSARNLVEDDWTPEAYEDVVKRLRCLK